MACQKVCKQGRTEICIRIGSTHHSGTVFSPKKYIKRKLWVWRVQKCIPLVGAKTVLTCTGLQTTPSHGGQYRAENGNLRKFGSTFHHGTEFAPKKFLYQRKLWVWRAQNCIPLVGAKTLLTCSGLEVTPFHGGQCRAKKGNLCKLGSPYRHGTMCAPK